MLMGKVIGRIQLTGKDYSKAKGKLMWQISQGDTGRWGGKCIWAQKEGEEFIESKEKGRGK